MRKLGRLARAASVPLAFGLSLEGTARIEDYLRYGTPPLAVRADLTVRDADGMHGRPGARYEKWVMNQLGMRGPEASPVKAPGTFRIVTMGASETFGLYETQGREYPRQLEDSLEAARRGGACPCAGVSRFEVLNGALAGMSLPTVIQDVRTRVRRLSPDVVLYYPTPVGYLERSRPTPALPDSSYPPASPPLRERLYPRMVNRLQGQLKQLLPGFAETWMRRLDVARSAREAPPGWRFERIPEERLAAYEADLRRLVGEIHAIGARPLLVTHANAFAPGRPVDEELLYQWARFYPRATGETILAFDSAARLVTLRVARDSGVAVLDAQPLLHRAYAQRVFQDFSHFTDFGAALAAGAMSRSLLGAAEASPRTLQTASGR